MLHCRLVFSLMEGNDRYVKQPFSRALSNNARMSWEERQDRFEHFLQHLGGGGYKNTSLHLRKYSVNGKMSLDALIGRQEKIPTIDTHTQRLAVLSWSMCAREAESLSFASRVP